MAPSFHNGARSILLRNSPSNFCYNHIGHFASAGHAVAKALFFGGVTRRFPDLNFAFLEGGVGWACMLYADLIGHWEKRNRQAIESTNPSKLDRRPAARAARRSTGARAVAEAVGRGEGLEGDSNSRSPAGSRTWTTTSGARSRRRKTSATSSCRASTSAARPTIRPMRGPSTARRIPCGARLNALFSSDIGHFDVPDMTEVVPEAYELVEHGLITDDDFHDFMFDNAVRFWGEVNPDFFKGTVVEKAGRGGARCRHALADPQAKAVIEARRAARGSYIYLIYFKNLKFNNKI